MELLLANPSDPDTCHRIDLTPGVPRIVGRREPADLVLSGDLTMSRRHFSITTDGEKCQIQDLNSTSGTFVNGKRISHVEIQEGDLILAGSTLLKVRLATGEATSQVSGGIEAGAFVTTGSDATLVGHVLQDPLHLAVESHLASHHDPLFAILDAARDPQIYAMILECKEPCLSLYSGMKGEELLPLPPYLVSLKCDSEFFDSLIRDGWGRSWGIFLMCDRPIEEIRKHLRRLLLVKTENGTQLLFRFYDPRVLRPFLATCTREELKEFFGPLKRILMEGAEPNQICQLSLGAQGLEERRELLG